MAAIKTLTLLLALAVTTTPATADPVQDDLAAIRKEYCAGEPFKPCLARFRDDMAWKQGAREAALEVCPSMVLIDPALRDFRHARYRNNAEFADGYQHVKTKYREGDFIWREIVCVNATLPESLHPKMYQKSWLQVRWTDDDRRPLVTDDELTKGPRAFQLGYYDGRCFQLGYFDRRCEALSQYNSEELFIDHVSYRRGKAAGRIDRDRAQRK